MAIVPCTRKRTSRATDTIQQLVTIFGHDFTTELNASLATLPAQSSIDLKINAVICVTECHSQEPSRGNGNQPLHLGSITLDASEIQEYLHEQSTIPITTAPLLPGSITAQEPRSAPTPEGVAHCRNPQALKSVQTQLSEPSSSQEERRNATERFRVKRASGDETPDSSIQASLMVGSTARQLQMRSREFPQRKKTKNQDVHQLQPSSVERFIAGVWKQIYSNIELAPISLDTECVPTITTGGTSMEAFHAINTLCRKITTMARCSRSLETIIQAYWVDCFEYRVKEIGIEKPFLSSTESRMLALRQACATLQWTEKELRNRLAIWRGYKEIKDIGGWACLVFAGSGIYRFCKYRVGFAKNLATKLGRNRSSLEVAADTIHPKWRKLLEVIGVESQPVYTGHPHDWVVCDATEPVTLKSTYLQYDPNFEYAHLEDSVLDEAAWGTEDPRVTAIASTAFCRDCGYFQSNNVSLNECRCFPELFGSCRAPLPVQVFRTPRGMNNGIIARCDFARGSAIAEFVGLVTRGLEGTDVMQCGSCERQYQIYQGRMGNCTRFVNHSCAPNSQFQKFCWLGSERVILVSKGIAAGEEVTVDYSHEYWEGLDKACLCGEPCCRYVRR